MKPEPEQPSRLALARAWLWAQITWPLEVRALKRAGFRRTGWQTWEL